MSWESVMASPPLQPAPAKRAGIASVTTIELFTGTMSCANSGSCAAQAFVASTTLCASTSPLAVVTLAGRPGSIPVTAERS
ncbi:hypothetical protein D9M68_649870 [compost metagenome]